MSVRYVPLPTPPRAWGNDWTDHLAERPSIVTWTADTTPEPTFLPCALSSSDTAAACAR